MSPKQLWPGESLKRVIYRLRYRQNSRMGTTTSRGVAKIPSARPDDASSEPSDAYPMAVTVVFDNGIRARVHHGEWTSNQVAALIDARREHDHPSA